MPVFGGVRTISKGSAPAAPDPQVTAAAQTQSNIATANNNASLNRVDQYSPYGSSVYNQTGTSSGGAPEYSQTLSLSPEQNALYQKYTQGQNALANTAIGSLGNVQGQLGTPFSYGGPNPTGSVASPSVGSTGNISAPGVGSTGSINAPTTAMAGLSAPTTGTTTDIANSGSGAVKQAQDAAYRGQTQYLDPQFKEGQDALDAKLANQGLQVGGAAYDKAQGDYARQKQAAYQSASDAAVGAGNQEQNVLFGQGLNQANLQNSVNAQQYGQNLGSANFQNSSNQQQFGQNLSAANLQNQTNQQQFGQNLSSADLQNQANQQQYGQNLGSANLQNQGSTLGLQQAAYLYNQPLSTYNSLITGSQPTSPTFNSVPGVNQANTDVAGITNQGYQNQLSAFNAQNQGINNLFSLGGSLGSAAIRASDRRLKRDIKRVGTTPGGIPTYTFRYNNDDEQTYFGVLADEVRHIPGAAVLMPNGFWGVNYSVVP